MNVNYDLQFDKKNPYQKLWSFESKQEKFA